ncbi:MAG TPA: ABC transporter substrate-binding protein [Pseudonocardiaceae bacterium]|jgi:NitT/TauT family transport system substrate-binding protein
MPHHHEPDQHPRAHLTRFRRVLGVLAAVLILSAGTACAGGQNSAQPVGSGIAPTLRLGYFANVTHAGAIVGVDKGFLRTALGTTTLQTQIFNAGPAEVEALFGGGLDAAFVGPNPAINAYGQSDGDAIRIIAGATSGGAQLVVRKGINSPQDLKGKTLATPQLGNTQDVALRSWLTKQGLKNSVQGGGDVTITPTANADQLQLFKDGKLDGAWAPEPWASRLVQEAGAKVLVDEKDLWPKGQFVTTTLIVRTEFLQQYPKTVEALLRGDVDAVQWINANSGQAKTVVNDGLKTLTGKPLRADVIDRAWQNETVTLDPIASSLQRNADAALAAGVTAKKVDLHGIYDLSILNRILTARGLPTVSSGGLGKE